MLYLSPKTGTCSGCSGAKALASGEATTFPRRHGFAWFLAFFCGRGFFLAAILALLALEAKLLSSSMPNIFSQLMHPSAQTSPTAGLDMATSDATNTLELGATADEHATTAKVAIASGTEATLAVENSIAKVQPVKAAIEQYYAKTKGWPKDNAAVGSPLTSPSYGDEISMVTVNDGFIDLTFGKGALAGHLLTLGSDDVNGKILWTCSSKTIAVSAMPPSCAPTKS